MSNIATSDLTKAVAFYGDILGLELIMDHGLVPNVRLGRKDDCSAELRF